jgi:UDP:flavonoid glycosyltransferase YjiC (YdhE family)
MLPVMAELAARGEGVRALVGTAFADAVRDAGAEAIVLDAVPDVFVPERFVGAAAVRFAVGRIRRPGTNARAARALAREVRRSRPDVMVLDPMIGWADRVARRSGVPSALFSTTFAVNDDVCAVVDGTPRWVSRLRPIVRRYRYPHRLVLVNAVPDLQPAAGRLAGDVHLVGPLQRSRHSDREMLELQVPRGHRVLYVSPGTVYARGMAFFHAIADAFADAPWLVVLATGHLDPDALGSTPSNVVVRRQVPQPLVLDHSDVFLTHAGMNSSLEGLAAGVPMALAPRSREQRFLARRLVTLGVGAHIDVRQGDPQALRQAITALADDPAVRAAATGWREHLKATDGPRLAADLLSANVRASGAGSG